MDYKLYYNELLILKTFKDRKLINRWFNFSTAQLAEYTGMTEQNLIRNLKKLVYKGYIVREMQVPPPGTFNHKRKRNYYLLTDKAVAFEIKELGPNPYTHPYNPREHAERIEQMIDEGANVLKFKRKTANSRS
jgi:DNA-binding PadR family transcriptional regulator